jgi:hypothetical protein
MSIRQAAGRVAASAAAVAGIGAGSVIMFSGTASASVSSQVVTVDPGDTNGNSHGFTPGQPFSSGQLVEVSAPANTSNSGTGTLAGSTAFTIWECSDPGGLPANLPTSETSCDNQTSLGQNGVTNADGSMDFPDYPVYSLPNAAFGETGSHLPKCDLGDPCVIAVITSPTDFSAPSGISFSQPFVIKATTGNTGANPGDGTPEAPLAIGLPLLGAAVVGGTLLRRNRKAKHLAATGA